MHKATRCAELAFVFFKKKETSQAGWIYRSKAEDKDKQQGFFKKEDKIEKLKNTGKKKTIKAITRSTKKHTTSTGCLLLSLLLGLDVPVGIEDGKGKERKSESVEKKEKKKRPFIIEIHLRCGGQDSLLHSLGRLQLALVEALDSLDSVLVSHDMCVWVVVEKEEKGGCCRSFCARKSMRKMQGLSSKKEKTWTDR